MNFNFEKQNSHPAVILLGRVFLSLIFIVSGLFKILSWDQNIQFMQSLNISNAPLLLVPAIVIEILCGLSILLGYKTQLGATLLFLYLIPVTLTFHKFWALEGVDKQIQWVNFMKNLSIMGGLAILSGFGAGRASIDAIFPSRRSVKTYTKPEIVKPKKIA